MTREAALAEARRRWGPTADAWGGDGKPFYGVRIVGTVVVRRVRGKFRETRKGVGPSWESAFADADRRAKEGKG